MKETERQNWIRIKEAMEKSGKTDNQFYIRAVEIAKGGDDPLADKLK